MNAEAADDRLLGVRFLIAVSSFVASAGQRSAFRSVIRASVPGIQIAMSEHGGHVTLCSLPLRVILSYSFPMHIITHYGTARLHTSHVAFANRHPCAHFCHLSGDVRPSGAACRTVHKAVGLLQMTCISSLLAAFLASHPSFLSSC